MNLGQNVYYISIIWQNELRHLNTICLCCVNRHIVVAVVVIVVLCMCVVVLGIHVCCFACLLSSFNNTKSSLANSLSLAIKGQRKV